MSRPSAVTIFARRDENEEAVKEERELAVDDERPERKA